jgi:hypothetical protein
MIYTIFKLKEKVFKYNFLVRLTYISFSRPLLLTTIVGRGLQKEGICVTVQATFVSYLHVELA